MPPYGPAQISCRNRQAQALAGGFVDADVVARANVPSLLQHRTFVASTLSGRVRRPVSAETSLGGRNRDSVSLTHDCFPSQTAKLTPRAGPCRRVKQNRPLWSFPLPPACVLFSVPGIPAPDRSGSPPGCWYPTRAAMRPRSNSVLCFAFPRRCL